MTDSIQYTYPDFPAIDRDERHFKRYIDFIESRNARVLNESYTESHHIVPRSLGGTNGVGNTIVLTAREHYIAHMMLWKCFSGPMTHAFFLMSICNRKKYDGRLTSKQYESLKVDRKNNITDTFREKMSEIMTGSERTLEHRQKISETLKRRYKNGEISRQTGRVVSKETREKIGSLCRGKRKKPFTEEHKRNIAISKLGTTHNEDTKKRLSEIQSNKTWVHKGTMNKLVDKHSKELEECLQNGWKKGMASKGKWMNNGVQSKVIPVDKIEVYIYNGWQMGRTQRGRI